MRSIHSKKRGKERERERGKVGKCENRESGKERKEKEGN